MLRFVILILIAIKIFCKNLENIFIISFEYKVIIKVKGPSPVQIINKSFSTLPSYIYNSKGNLIAQNKYEINIEQEEEIITMKWNSKLTKLSKMFFEVQSIIEIDLSNYDSSSVNAMNMMFQDCTNVKKIVFTNFKTDKVTSSYSMFYRCKYLTSLDLSSFRTKINRNFGSMFCGCESLTSLDLSTFDTSTVTHIDNMFKDCVLLTSLNLKSFKTIKGEKINRMFYNCRSLIYLDLSNLDTTNIYAYEEIFTGCSNLKYLNLNNVIERNGFDFSTFFSGVPENIIICINEEKTPILYGLIKQKQCPIEDCLEEMNVQNVSILVSSSFCTAYLFSYNNNNCYENCELNFIIKGNEENFPNKNCLYQINKCLDCSFDSLINKNLCNSCNLNEGFYPKENDPKNVDNYYECYHKNEIQNRYYLDNNDLLFKPCYDSCDTCDQKGDATYHYCLTCKNNYTECNNEFYSSLNNNYKNCYEKCPFYYYIDLNMNKTYCIEYPECPFFSYSYN